LRAGRSGFFLQYSCKSQLNHALPACYARGYLQTESQRRKTWASISSHGCWVFPLAFWFWFMSSCTSSDDLNDIDLDS
jgi:hypothetical protein